MKKIIGLVIALLFAFLLITTSAYAQNDTYNAKAAVVANNGTEEVENEKLVQKIQKINVRILEGEYKGEEYEIKYVLTDNVENTDIKATLQEGEKVVVTLEEKDGEVVNININDVLIDTYIPAYIGIGIIVLLILIIQRRKALKSLLILSIAVLSIYYVYILNISGNGNIILLLSLITSILILLFTSIIINGISKKTVVSVLLSSICIGLSFTTIYMLLKIVGLSGNTWCSGLERKYININDFVLSIGLMSSSIISTILSNIIVRILEESNKLFYKGKSKNIIEGQRSLKL